IKPLAAACESDSPQQFRAWARQQLAAQAEPFFSTMPDNQADTPALHQFRIRAKALRYTIELVASAFDMSLRTEHYPLVEELQERLGRINDAASASQHIRGWSDEVADAERQQELRGFADQETARLEERLREFREWWTAERADQLKNALATTSTPATQQ